MTARPYKVLSISFYTDDLARLDAKVDDLKANGYPKVSRSMLLRVAVACFDPSLLSVELQRALAREHGVPEPKRHVRCTECDTLGHNAATCSEANRAGA